MGVSGTAVLYMVLLRAFVTGIAAACVSWGLAKSVCLLLRWEPSSSASSDGLTSLIVALKPHAVAFIDLAEDWPIALTAVVCSLAGSLIPAVIAARLDPIEALVTGKESQ